MAERDIKSGILCPDQRPAQMRREDKMKQQEKGWRQVEQPNGILAPAPLSDREEKHFVYDAKEPVRITIDRNRYRMNIPSADESEHSFDIIIEPKQ